MFQVSRRRLLVLVAVCTLAAGCIEAEKPAAPKGDGESILKKKTQDIGKYDPAAGRTVSDSKVRATNPITGPLEAYGPMVEQMSKVTVDQMLLMYYTEHGRWPNYDEFMSQIIKANNVWLPVLPAKMEYQYDEANHQLVVVYPPDSPEGNADDAKEAPPRDE
jgi:hypothetical protein